LLITNPVSLLALARSKLKIVGKVETQEVSELSSPEFANVPALTCSNDDASQHLVRYKPTANDTTLLHEFCHVKLNEIGFKTVELRVSNHGQAPPEVKKAIVLVAEAYADAMLFRHFGRESLMKAMDERLLSARAIQKVVRELHSEGIIASGITLTFAIICE
jgi:hypothetical protein